MRGMKTGGRLRGTLNRATVEKRLEIARQLDDAKNRGKPLAKDRLDELLSVAFDMMAATKPVTADIITKARAGGDDKLGEWNVEEFGAWFDRAAYVAKELAKYQSPTFKAIAVTAPAPASPGAAIETDNVVDLNDPNAAARLYLRTIQRVG